MADSGGIAFRRRILLQLLRSKAHLDWLTQGSFWRSAVPENNRCAVARTSSMFQKRDSRLWTERGTCPLKVARNRELVLFVVFVGMQVRVGRVGGAIVSGLAAASDVFPR